MHSERTSHRALLERIADRAMVEAGLLPHFSNAAQVEVSRMDAPAAPEPGMRDLRSLLWCSIDNDDSLDLDQLSVAETLPGDKIRVLVAVADVDALVRDGSAVDAHARQNTTSVYTAARIYPMLPEKLSTGLTSLNLNEDRLAMVVDMTVETDGRVSSESVYRAVVHNRAKLAYNSVAAWLEGSGPEPKGVGEVPGLDANLRVQDTAAQRLKALRERQGALSLETIEAKPVFDQDELTALDRYEKNRAGEIIENFMVSANGAVARYLSASGFASIRRVVRVPRRWDRIVEIAAQKGYGLPSTPDSGALEKFLLKQKAEDPVRFPDLSLSVIKLLGSGEYAVDPPGEPAPGHFGLAVKDYAHSTAPNRRYPDLLTQRLVKAALASKPAPYDETKLEDLAQHCTMAEDIATKVERRVAKSAAAILMENRIGEQFEGVITGAADKGTWVRIFSEPVEGKVVKGFQGVDVGDRVHVRLIETDVERGFIDFALVGRSRK